MEFYDDETEEYWRDVRVVYYDGGVPVKYEDAPAAVYSADCRSNKGLKTELWSLAQALRKPVLRPSDFPDFTDFVYSDK